MVLIQCFGDSCATADIDLGNTETTAGGPWSALGWGGSAVASPRTGSSGSYSWRWPAITAAGNWWMNAGDKDLHTTIPSGYTAYHNFWHKVSTGTRAYTQYNFESQTNYGTYGSTLTTTWTQKYKTWTTDNVVTGFRFAWSSSASTQISLDDFSWYYDDPGQPPYAPTVLKVEGESTNVNVNTLIPAFTMYYDDPDAGDFARYVYIQVSTDSGDYVSSLVWDSGWLELSSWSPGTEQGTRIPDVAYAGTALTDGVTYYWRAKLQDDDANEGSYSNGLSSFQMELESKLRGSIQLKTATLDTVDFVDDSIDVEHLVLGTGASDINADEIPFESGHTYGGSASNVMDALEEIVFDTGDTVAGKRQMDFTETPDGSSTVFTLQRAMWQPPKIFKNGQLQIEGAGDDYTRAGVLGAGPITITFLTAPLASDSLRAVYWGKFTP